MDLRSSFIFGRNVREVDVRGNFTEYVLGRITNCRENKFLMFVQNISVTVPPFRKLNSGFGVLILGSSNLLITALLGVVGR